MHPYTKLRAVIATVSLALLLAGSCLAQSARLNEPRMTEPDMRKPLSLPPAPQETLAARRPSLSLSPAVVMTQGTFGQSVRQALTLSNATPYELAFDMMAEDVTVESGKRSYVAAGQLPGSIAATAVFSQKQVTVKPFTTAAVDVHFTIPPGSPLRAVVALFRGTTRLQGAAARRHDCIAGNAGDLQFVRPDQGHGRAAPGLGPK